MAGIIHCDNGEEIPPSSFICFLLPAVSVVLPAVSLALWLAVVPLRI